MADQNTLRILSYLDGDKSSLTLIGSSLGGALSNAMALKYGLSSMTFNPAWLHNDIIDKIDPDLSNAGRILNVVVDNEILNWAYSNKGSLTASPLTWSFNGDVQSVGTSKKLISSDGKNVTPTDAHMIGRVIELLEFHGIK